MEILEKRKKNASPDDTFKGATESCDANHHSYFIRPQHIYYSDDDEYAILKLYIKKSKVYVNHEIISCKWS